MGAEGPFLPRKKSILRHDGPRAPLLFTIYARVTLVILVIQVNKWFSVCECVKILEEQNEYSESV